MRDRCLAILLVWLTVWGVGCWFPAEIGAQIMQVPNPVGIGAGSPCADGEVPTTTSDWACATPPGGGEGSPGGLTTQVQFHDDGLFGGDAGLTYNKTTDALSVTGNVSSASLTVTGSTNAVEVAVRRNAGQTADIQQWQTEGAAMLARVDDDGSFVTTSNVTSTSLTVNNGSAAAIPVAIRGAAAQSANIQVWETNGGVDLAWVTADGTVAGSALILTPVEFASLGADANGTLRYCSDCAKATPCAGSGTGAFAKRMAGAWDCD